MRIPETTARWKTEASALATRVVAKHTSPQDIPSPAIVVSSFRTASCRQLVASVALPTTCPPTKHRRFNSPALGEGFVTFPCLSSGILGSPPYESRGNSITPLATISEFVSLSELRLESATASIVAVQSEPFFRPESICSQARNYSGRLIESAICLRNASLAA